MSIDDFEPLAIIGRGAFGEVKLVRKREETTVSIPSARLRCMNDTSPGVADTSTTETSTKTAVTHEVYAMKAMLKEAMIVKNKVSWPTEYVIQ